MLRMCSSCRHISGRDRILCGCVCSTSYFLVFELRLRFINRRSWRLLSWQLPHQLICINSVRGVSEMHFPSAVNIDSLDKNRECVGPCCKQINKKCCPVTDIRLMKQEGHLGPSHPGTSIDPSLRPPPSDTVAMSRFPSLHSTCMHSRILWYVWHYWNHLPSQHVLWVHVHEF